MPQVRFNHMELTVPRGTLDAEMRAELAAFYGGVLGWETKDVEIVGGLQFLMLPDDGQFILLAEGDRPLESPGYDHLGLLMETRAEVDDVLAGCQEFQQRDDRMLLKVYQDLAGPTIVVHAFYVKYLLPIWFDVQCMEYPQGPRPGPRWQFA